MTIARRTTLSAAILATLASSAVFSQTTTANGLALEEVLVTAEKRESTLQETPISLLAFSAEQLDRHGIADLGDISGLVPNVEITPFPVSRSSLVIFMRGVGNNDSQSTQDPAVGVYIDGVYMARSIGLTSDVADLERVEVLRGPQGTLYGRNTTGGAINLITAKPADDFGVSQTLSTGSRGYWRSLSKLDTGKLGQFSGKLTYLQSEHDGWVENTGAGQNFGEEEKTAGRLALRWDASETFSLDYAYDFSEVDGPQHYYQRVVDIVPNPADPANSNRESSGSWDVGVTPSSTEVSGHSLIAVLETSLGVLTSTTGYRELDETIVQDYGAGAPGFHVNISVEQEQFSQELQLVGAHSDVWRYVAGLYYFQEEGLELEVDTFAGFPAEDRRVDSEAEAWAGYGQLTWSPVEFDHKLDVTLGARYTVDDRSATKDSAVYFTGGPQSASDDWSNFNPSVTVDYAWSDELSSYAKIVSAYKSGGFNVRSTEAGFQPAFEEETILSYEAGVKSTFLDRRIRLNAAVFHSEYTDMQLQQITNNATIFLTDVYNVGEAEIDGFEFDVTAVLLEGLTMQVSYGYTDADFVEYIDQSGTAVTNPSFGTDIASQAVMPYAPEHTYTVGLAYEASLGFANLNATIDYNWRDERYGTALNADLAGFFLDDYGLLNARVALSDFSLGDLSLEVAAWGRNLDKQDYRVHSISLGTQHSAYFGEPQTVGLDISLKF